MTTDHEHDTPKHARPAGFHVPGNAWYAMLESRRLGRKPVTVERLGRRFVLFRDGSGQAAASDPRCPHRGADLGLGRVVDGCLECPYHGFRFAADGACTLVPCDGLARPIRPDMRVQTFPVREHRGIIWLFWGAARAQLPPIPWFEELPPDERHSHTRVAVWKAAFPRVMEGNLDIHHFPFLHRRAAWGVGTLLDPYTATLAGDVIRTHGVLREDDGKPYSGRGGLALALSVHFPGLLLATFGGERLKVMAAMTPIDGARTLLVTRYYVEVPVVGRLLAWLSALMEGQFVLSDDERMLASSEPQSSDRHTNKLVRADAGIGLWHKCYERSRRADTSAAE